jgi:hypothetical protein
LLTEEAPAVRCATWLALCVLLSAVGWFPAQSPAPKKPAEKNVTNAEPKRTPEQLIDQFADLDFRKRDEAGKALETLGTKALPALRKARDHADPEVQRRVGLILPQLEIAELLAPKRVTLDLKKKTVRQIMDELSKKSGYKIEFFGGDPQQLYDLKANNLPFWEAFDRLCQSAGLVLQIGYGDNVIRLNQQDSYVPYVNYRGSFRLVANSFNYNRSIDFSTFPKHTGGTQRNESMNFGFTVCVEPKIPLMSVGEPRLTEAADDEGRSMLLAGRNPDEMGGAWMGGGRFVSRYNGGYKAYCMQTYVNLSRPSEKSRSVKVIKGSVPVTLLAEEKPEVVSDDILKAKGKKVQIGNVSFDIQDVTTNPNKHYSIKLSITNNDKDNPNDYTWMNSLHSRIELQDTKGNKYQHFGSSWSGAGNNHVDLTFTYGNNGNTKMEPPKKLIYQSWTLVNHQVSFEFKNLPLP